MNHCASCCYNWLISGQQSVNPSREEISILSRKYKRFMFVYPVVNNEVGVGITVKL